jgi:hypothetical protein
MRVAFDRKAGWTAVLAALFIAGFGPGVALAGDLCDIQFDSTFELIEKVIFQDRGCTSSGCHDESAQGGLVLLPGVAYDNLIDQPVQSVSPEQYPALRRVVPARKDRSLLWLNVAAATRPDLWRAPKQPMPLGFPPLLQNELDLLSMWFDYGAPREGVVPGTGELVDACLPKPEPLRIEPLPPPAPGEGLQIRAPHQVLAPKSERETCFVSYYDFTGKVPEESLGPNGDVMRVKGIEGRQDPLSHHVAVLNYKGTTPIDSPVWGPFACRGGERDGQACEPTDTEFCGADGVCASPPVQSLACIGYGPGDAGIGTTSDSLYNTMATGAWGVEGVYVEVPLKGILVWNSHAFNVTDSPAGLDMWINFEFAPEDEQLRLLTRAVDVSKILAPRAPAFGTGLVCQHYVVPPDVSVLDIGSHTHKRGKRFRVFLGRFACSGGPSDGEPCLPLDADADFPLPDICAGAPCVSSQPPAAGDCNQDMDVSTAELLTGVGIALGRRAVDDCTRFDADDDRNVSIEELIVAVDAAMNPGRMRSPEESLFYTSITYADPLILNFNPPMQLGGFDTLDEERSLTYCAEFDNGFLDPSTVKRNSRVPTNGSRCSPPHCAEGDVGAPCEGASAAQRDQSCDSQPGMGDGFCDACTVTFGVTTDDEMFVLASSQVPR